MTMPGKTRKDQARKKAKVIVQMAVRLPPEVHSEGEALRWRLHLSWQKMMLRAIEEFLARNKEDGDE